MRPEGDRIQCRCCNWAAEMRGGSIEERMPFLEERFIIHMKGEHPGVALEYNRFALVRAA